MDVARVNCSHGTTEELEALVRAVRAVEERLDRPLAILADLPGPKLRVARLAQPRLVVSGDDLVLASAGAASRRGSGARLRARLRARRAPGLAGDDRRRPRPPARRRGARQARPLPRRDRRTDPVAEGRQPARQLPADPVDHRSRPRAARARGALGRRLRGALVRAAGRGRRGSQAPRAGARRPPARDRQDREARGDRAARGDRRRHRRADGRARRPRRRDRRGRGADAAEAPHPHGPGGGQDGDHGDADARVDDRRARADPRGGLGRRQRHPRRHLRGHAERRDGGGLLPRRGRRHDGAHRGRGRAGVRLPRHARSRRRGRARATSPTSSGTPPATWRR